MDREEFYRLKKVSNKKQKDAAEEEAARKAKKDLEKAQATEGETEAEAASQDTPDSKDMLGDEDNQDVIF